MTAWIAVAAAGAGSYLFRISMLAVAERFGVPAFLERAARFAVPAAFAALAAAGLARHAGDGRAAVAPAAAVVAAVLAVRRTRAPHAAIIAGLPALWLVSALTGA